MIHHESEIMQTHPKILTQEILDNSSAIVTLQINVFLNNHYSGFHSDRVHGQYRKALLGEHLKVLDIPS